MHEPRPVSLTDQERRRLRAIGDALAADDPTLAALLGEGGPRARRRITRTALTIVVAIGLLGLVLADIVLQTSGAMLLLAAPPAVWWLARRVRSRRW